MPTLSKRRFRVLRELARALFDDGTGIPESRLDWLEGELRDMFGRVGWMARLGVRIAILFVQLAPILLIGRACRFTSLAAAERVRYLERLERSFFAVLLMALKFYLAMLYFEHPETLAISGYDGRGLLWPRDAATPGPQPIEAGAGEVPR